MSVSIGRSGMVVLERATSNRRCAAMVSSMDMRGKERMLGFGERFVVLLYFGKIVKSNRNYRCSIGFM